jgi:hypothetical protein
MENDVSSPDLPDGKQKSGVVSDTDIYFLEYANEYVLESTAA